MGTSCLVPGAISHQKLLNDLTFKWVSTKIKSPEDWTCSDWFHEPLLEWMSAGTHGNSKATPKITTNSSEWRHLSDGRQESSWEAENTSSMSPFTHPEAERFHLFFILCVAFPQGTNLTHNKTLVKRKESTSPAKEEIYQHCFCTERSHFKSHSTKITPATIPTETTPPLQHPTSNAAFRLNKKSF